MNRELHLFILWERARAKEKEILKTIQSHLKILECYDIAWCKRDVANNFSRFYGTKLNNNSSKEKECGNGRFLLVTVLDESPEYGFLETSRGHEYLNTNLFQLKKKFRNLTGGGHKVHSTNSTREANHDITLLLGKNYHDYLKTAPSEWDGSYKRLEQNLIGCNGWNNLEELFYTLNNTINYVVLRNHECLPKQFCTIEHGDIDILVDDYQNAAFLLNAKPVYKTPNRVHHRNIVNEQEVFWDIRYVGDEYYCKEWQEAMLSTKVTQNSINIQSPENYFYSLVYHACIHKKLFLLITTQKQRSSTKN